MQNKNLILLENIITNEKKDFQDLGSVEVMKINHLKKIILIELKILIKRRKKDLILNLKLLIMINQEEKKDLVLNLVDLKIEKKQKIHLNSKNTGIAVEVKIELFKILYGAARETRTLTGIPHLALNQACLPIPT